MRWSHTPRRRRQRAIAGLFLLTTTGLGFFLADPARGEEVEEQAAVTRHAYFTHPLTQPVPPVLFSGFPPGTACLVAGLVGVPEVCGEAVQDVVDALGLGDGVPVPVTPDSAIAQPVLPGTTPVGMLGGQERYVSLLQFGLPTIPAGEELSSLELVLHQDGLNFALESPAFRELVFATISQVEAQEPELFVDVLSRVVSGELPALAQSVTGIEACPIVESWNGGSGQDAALDGSRLPDSDCILGTTGVFDPAAGTWTFDLTFAAQAWTSGSPDGEVLANEGIILRPVGAPNVAYGDPDLSTNFLISLADGDNADAAKRPRLRYATVPAAVSGADRPTPSTAAAPARPTSGVGSVSTPRPVTPDLGAAPAAPMGVRARWVDRAVLTGHSETAGWVYLLVPAGVAGAYLFGGALLAEPDVVRHRPGALSRLMERRSATSS